MQMKKHNTTKHMGRAMALLLAVLFAAMPVSAAESRRDDDRTQVEATKVYGFDFKPSEKYKYSDIKKKITTHQKTNAEVRGWLTVPGTNIDVPITYSSKGNERYIYRTWEGKGYTKLNYLNYVRTAEYVDYRTIMGESWAKTSRNTTIYGHNWTNLRNPLDIGTNNNHIMFGQLPSYTNLEFLKTNPYIYYSTDTMEGIWKVFAVAYSEDDPHFFYVNPNPGTITYQKNLDEWRARSLYNADFDVQSTDRIITLSTCTRMYDGVSSLQRYVVVARLLREGESDTDKITYTVNPSPKQPIFNWPKVTANTSQSSSATSEAPATSASQSENAQTNVPTTSAPPDDEPRS